MKNNKGLLPIPNTKILFIALSMIALMIILFLGFAKTGALVNIQLQENGYRNEPLQTGTFNFLGIEGNYETTWLGSLSSQGGAGTVTIDGDNDGERVISNSLDAGIDLTLKSTNQVIGSQSGSTNYIEAKINLPAGKGVAYYSYQASSYYGDDTKVYFKINDIEKTFGTSHFTVAQRGGGVSGSETYEFELLEANEITIKVQTTTSSKNENAIGEIKLAYTPNPVKEEPAEEQTFKEIIDEKESSGVKLTFKEKFNLWFENLIYKIFHWRPEII